MKEWLPIVGKYCRKIGMSDIVNLNADGSSSADPLSNPIKLINGSRPTESPPGSRKPRGNLFAVVSSGAKSPREFRIRAKSRHARSGVTLHLFISPLAERADLNDGASYLSVRDQGKRDPLANQIIRIIGNELSHFGKLLVCCHYPQESEISSLPCRNRGSNGIWVDRFIDCIEDEGETTADPVGVPVHTFDSADEISGFRNA